jgi:segregation and condensation protein A
MSIDPASHQAHRYTVATPIFEGPLDLLLHLIERAELDITRLALAQVTDQYLEHLHTMSVLAAEEVSAFLVVAARLLQIKSEALLPRPPVHDEGEEDPGEALARQLIEYRKYKKIAGWLSEREAAGLRTYLRLAPPIRLDSPLDLNGMGIPDLVEAARQVLSRLDQRPELRIVVAPPRVTIRQKIGLIFKQLHQKGKETFLNLLREAHSRLEVVVTFLAMLELIKRQRVQVRQELLFGEIILEPAQDWNENEDFELEFGE